MLRVFRVQAQNLEDSFKFQQNLFFKALLFSFKRRRREKPLQGNLEGEKLFPPRVRGAGSLPHLPRFT